MRIAFLSTILDYPWGGADFLWTRAAEAAAARGDKLLLIVSPTVGNHPRVQALRAQGAEFFPLLRAVPAGSVVEKLRRRFRRWTGRGDAVVNRLRQFGADLVVISCGATYDLAYLPAWADWLLASRTRFRLVANWQLDRPTLAAAEASRMRRVFAAADAVCFVSTRNRDSTSRHLEDPLPRGRVIHNPLRWTPSDVSPWPASPPWSLATVSRLDPGKGLDLLLRAAAEVLPLDAEWRIVIHGIGPAEQDLRQLVTALHLDARVRFAGYVPDLRTIWGNNHLMVSPSLEDGVPMTIPEALLCERPVLSNAIGGAEDWVRDGESGFLSARPNLESFAPTLARAWEQRQRWQEMGRSGAITARAGYRPDDYQQLIQP